jgi:inosose dehydratase/3D-(3,5/4)-trihydroxycyclohexane-1,2-dione acylhydrolase (decyclizing)
MTVRIGTNPIAWSNDDLRELGGATPLEACLAEAREAGFEGIELGHKFPRDAATLQPLLDRYGLALVGGWHSVELLRRSAEEEFSLGRPHLALLQAMGVRVFIIAETSNAIHGERAKPLSLRPRLRDEEWPLFGVRLTEFGKRIEQEGLQVVYHHHMGTVVETGEEIARLMEATGPELGLLLDTGHATWGAADPVALARDYRQRIGHVHCKDVRLDVMRAARAGDLSFLDAVIDGVYTVPGDGGVDFVSLLKEIPCYDGWLVVEAEQDPEKANPLTYARMGYRNLSQYVTEAGLGRALHRRDA